MKSSEATILVVDDEPELREIFVAWLARNGYRVLAAANGMEALSLLTLQDIHAVISDIRMPVMDGIALIRRMAELKLHIPSIIFVSGFGDIDAREAYALGVEAMIAKPIGRMQLLAALRNCLSLREDLWLAPPGEEAEFSVAASFPSLLQAMEERTLQFGCGGFSMFYDKPVGEGTVAFSIQMVKEGIDLKGQGVVRWVASQKKRIGVEFIYLEPQSREWVMRMLADTGNFSFIPSY